MVPENGFNKITRRPIFEPATLLFLDHRSLRTCSFVTPRGQPKFLAAPLMPIYELTS
jgi:hypothetical protein